MTLFELLNLSNKQCENYISTLSKEECEDLKNQLSAKLMRFVKMHLEKYKPALKAVSCKSPYATLEIENKTFGTIHLVFLQGRKCYRYYVISNNLSKIFPAIGMIASTPKNTAVGEFIVRYEENINFDKDISQPSNIITKHFTIKVG